MDSSSGNSSGSTQIQNSGSNEERKRKRMESNRESARRSRMRKQKNLQDITAQINQLKNNNNHIITTIKITSQQFLQTEAENSVLMAQIDELSQRLDYLNEIINCMNNNTCGMFELEQCDFFNNQWNMMYLNHGILHE